MEVVKEGKKDERGKGKNKDEYEDKKEKNRI